MLRPLFRQQYGRKSHVNKSLELALKWWAEVLFVGIKETKVWRSLDLPPVRLYADARSTPPRLAAVLVNDGRRAL